LIVVVDHCFDGRLSTIAYPTSQRMLRLIMNRLKVRLYTWMTAGLSSTSSWKQL